MNHRYVPGKNKNKNKLHKTRHDNFDNYVDGRKSNRRLKLFAEAAVTTL